MGSPPPDAVLCVVSADGSGLTQIPPPAGMSPCRGPIAWRQDGEEFVAAFSRRRAEAQPELYRIRLPTALHTPELLSHAGGLRLGAVYTGESVRLLRSDPAEDAPTEVVTVAPDGASSAERLTPESAAILASGRDYALCPDGRRVAFVRDHDVWVMDLGSGEANNVVAYAGCPSWSPGGELLVVGDDPVARTGGRSRGVRVVDPMSREVTSVLPMSDRVCYASVCWSPDEDWIAGAATSYADAHVFTVHRDGSSRRRLAVDGWCSWPSWGPETK